MPIVGPPSPATARRSAAYERYARVVHGSLARVPVAFVDHLHDVFFERLSGWPAA
jgi:hypothetical protein